MSKRITLEQLAVMIANGFADTARKADVLKLEKRVESLENTMTTEIGRLDIRLAQMAPNFDVKDLTKRVTKIEKHLKFA